MQSYLLFHDGSQYAVGDDWVPIDCFRCGICCLRYRPKVSNEEITIIAAKLKVPLEDFLDKFVSTSPRSGEYILDDGGKQCPFLTWHDGTVRAECTIHPFRPRACRNWQASLSRIECQEGLQQLNPEEKIILPENIYLSHEEAQSLSSAIRRNSKSE